MATEHEGRNRHFLLKGVTETEPFRSRGMGQRREVPVRNRQQHSSVLREQLAEVQASSDSEVSFSRELSSAIQEFLRDSEFVWSLRVSLA